MSHLEWPPVLSWKSPLAAPVMSSEDLRTQGNDPILRLCLLLYSWFCKTHVLVSWLSTAVACSAQVTVLTGPVRNVTPAPLPSTAPVQHPSGSTPTLLAPWGPFLLEVTSSAKAPCVCM